MIITRQSDIDGRPLLLRSKYRGSDWLELIDVTTGECLTNLLHITLDIGITGAYVVLYYGDEEGELAGSAVSDLIEIGVS